MTTPRKPGVGYQIDTEKWPFQRGSEVDDGHPQLHDMSSHTDRHKGVDIASAAALTPGNDGDYYEITGTTTITSITARAPGDRILFKIVSGGLTFTHSTGVLNLRGRVDYTSIARDIIEFVADSTTEWTEIRRSAEGGSLLIGREFTLTMETGANWFTVSSPPTIGNVAGCKFTITPTLTMPTGACWFTTSFSLCNFACQCNC